MRSVLPVVALALPALLLGGCGGWDEGSALTLTRLSRSVTAQGDGLARVNVPLDRLVQQYDKMLLSSSVSDGDETVYVDRIEGPDGLLRRLTSDLEVAEFRTGAVADQELNHFNWPIGADDAWLEQEQVTVFIGAVTADRTLRPNATFDVDVLLTSDDDADGGDAPPEGTLEVNVHYMDGVEQDEAYQAAFDAALVRMEDIFFEIGLTVVVQVVPADQTPPGPLPRPGFGAPDTWTELSEGTSNPGIDLVIVDTIAGSDPTILGAAGSIPGGLLASPESGVILSAAANAGPDLVYSESEIDLLGSTMAHEVAHMLGLFHPVDLGYDRWDALEDTEKCESEAACQAALGENLMYPTALCTQSTCLPQENLSDGQAGVVHRYTGVQ